MRNTKKLISAALAACAFFAFTAAAAPGTDEDPLISKSYLDSVVYPYIDSAVASDKAGVQIINLEAGESIYCTAGTELILRGGEASVIASQRGGVCDVTSGYDLADGTEIYPNHLLIVPVEDGRGAYAETDAIFMVRGSFELD